MLLRFLSSIGAMPRRAERPRLLSSLLISMASFVTTCGSGPRAPGVVRILYRIPYGWSWMIMDDHGWSWMIMDDHGWSWMIMDDHGWSWMYMMYVMYCSFYSWCPQSFYKTSWNFMKHPDPVPRLVEKDCSAVHHPKPGTVGIPFIVLTWWSHRDTSGGLIWYHHVPTSHRFRFCQFWRPTGMRFMFFHRFTLGRPFTKDLDNSPGFVYPWVIKHGNMAVGNPLEMEVSIGECGKIMENHGKSWKIMENHGKSWKIIEKMLMHWESRDFWRSLKLLDDFCCPSASAARPEKLRHSYFRSSQSN